MIDLVAFDMDGTVLDSESRLQASALEAIAWRDPRASKDLKELREIKGWFLREFGSEVVKISAAAPQPPPENRTKQPSGRRGPDEPSGAGSARGPSQPKT